VSPRTPCVCQAAPLDETPDDFHNESQMQQQLQQQMQPQLPAPPQQPQQVTQPSQVPMAPREAQAQASQPVEPSQSFTLTAASQGAFLRAQVAPGLGLEDNEESDEDEVSASELSATSSSFDAF
jgi:biotin carboxyl carrier protein